MRMLVALVASSLLVSGCTRRMAPPAEPDPIPPPTQDLPPLAEGQGRVIVDVVDGPTEVHRATTRSIVVGIDKDRPIVVSRRSTEQMCVSPCAVDLSPGRYTLAFPTPGGSGRFELDVVDVKTEPTVYLRDLGRYESAGAGLPLGILGVVFGGAAMITGVTLLPVGVATDNDGMALAGGITLGSGAVLTTLGILGIALSPSLEQPGTGVQFPLEAR